jgi:type IV pilus assembly protein PilY1
MTTIDKFLRNAGKFFILAAVIANAHAITDIAQAPLVTSSSATQPVRPNVMFMLDDSGSMDWDYMPDDAKNFAGRYGFNSSQCNGVYYNPNLTYQPPVDSTGASYGDATFTNVLVDGFDTASGTNNLDTDFTGGSGTGASGYTSYTGHAFYYTYSGTQTTALQMNYHNTNSIFYKECYSNIGSTTAVDGTHPVNTVFTKTTLGSTETSNITINSSAASGTFTITVAGSSSTPVSSITVGGTTITSGSSTGSTTTNTEASNLKSKITSNGYSATVSGAVITVTGPATVGAAVVVNKSSGTDTFTVSAISPLSTVSGITVNGTQLMSGSAALGSTTSTTAANIAAKINLGGFTATASGSTVTITGPTSAANYTPVVTSSGTMTYTADQFPDITPAHLINFANWYSYYSTRMLMMKTGVGLAFVPVDDKYRVGFMTMNNNVNPDIVDIATFDATQKSAWYSKLYASNPGNSTPLREVLAKIGGLYAHKYGASTIYTATIKVSGSTTTTVSSIQVNGVELLSGPSTGSNKSSTVAKNIVSQLIDPSAYTGVASSSTITITGPAGASGYAPVVTSSGGMTFTVTSFTPSTVAANLNGISPNDPVQYSCQQNFTILSTDGYWNGNAGYKLDGSTAVGNQDGTEIRPQLDGAIVTTKTATPTTTVDQTQTVKNYTTTTPWTQTVTTLNGACSVPAVTPSNTTNAYMSDNSHKMALGLSSTNPEAAGTPARCVSLGGTGANTAWFCRGGGSGANPVVSSSSVTDSTGKTWYLVSSVSGNTGCTTNNTAWGSGYSTSKGACPGTAAVSGTWVNTQKQTATETAAGTNTSVDNATTVSTSTVTCTSGLCGAAVITTVGPTSSNVSSVNSVSSDTTSAYSNTGTVPTSHTCMVTPPAAGTSTPVAGTSSTTYGTPSTTTLSTTATVGTPTVTKTATGGTSDTLADVAEYYYVNDLRDASLSNQIGALGTDVTKNNVPASGNLDTATWQHMTTFTLGLGARGSMVFDSNYVNGSSVDYNAVKNGSLANSASGICSWQGDNTVCNWPIPASGSYTNIDDLWHAAVDGRGTYFSATDPATLSAGLASALAGVRARTGTSASASISNPNISTGDNYIFSSNFVTQDWYGRLIRQQLDLNTAALSSVIDWEAGGMLATNTARNIYTYSNSSSNHLQAFNAANFGSNANFATAHISSLTQFCTTGTSCLTAAQQTAAAGANLVSYLAGDRTNEGYPADPAKYYRQRVELLGDIVDSQAAYVKSPLLLYSDPGYAAFVTAKANRQSMIYVGANDGMLHAFYANTDMMDNVSGDVVTTGGVGVAGGQEAWAYIPTAVMPNLYQLADISYASLHRYFVDGSPVATDICPTTPALDCTGTTWKTILVEGLNGGGNSFFAMDVTNPAAPIVLWEFTNTNLGYSYGNPQVVKLGGAGTGSLAAGTWVVLLTSGYNNADGQGHLFVLNAYTGALLMDITTGVGSASNPSGLSKIIAQVVNPSFDATVLQVYGGDLFGNVWRFDVNGNVGATGNDAQLLAVLTGPTGLTQPITTKPEVGLVNGKVVVYVGTGRYLGISDMDGSNTTQLSPNLQTMYGIMDPLLGGTTPNVAIYPNPRTQTTNAFVQQTEYDTICPAGAPATVCSYGQIIRTSTDYPVNIPTNSGWYIDFPDSGERLNTDPVLELGMLAFNTNVPNASDCSIGGDSWNYLLDYTSGSFLSNSTVTISAAFAATLPPGMAIANADGTYSMGVAADQHTGSLSTAPVPISLPNGNKAICTNDSTGQLICRLVNAPPPPGGARRVSWRELLSQ